MKARILIMALLAGVTAHLSAQKVKEVPCATPEALGRQLLRCLIHNDSAGLHELVPTVNNLELGQRENGTPGAFLISTEEAKGITQKIDSVAMSDFRKARQVIQGIPSRSLRVTSIEETEQAGDMPYRTIVLDLGKGTLTCSLEIRVAMGFSSGWKLGLEGFGFHCVQE